MQTADELIDLLQLHAHPEGGFYREVFRDAKTNAHGRAASTAIYFLLKAGQISTWHRVDAAEVWHWYCGAPLELQLSSAADPRDAQAPDDIQTHVLGVDFMAGQRPQAVVPAGNWQSARSLGAFTLVGCTVAPGFEFAGFELLGTATDDAQAGKR